MNVVSFFSLSIENRFKFEVLFNVHGTLIWDQVKLGHSIDPLLASCDFDIDSIYIGGDWEVQLLDLESDSELLCCVLGLDSFNIARH